MRFNKVSHFHQLPFAAIGLIVALSLAPPASGVASAATQNAAARSRSAGINPAIASRCTGSWSHPAYMLDITAHDDGQTVAILTPEGTDDNPGMPIIGDVAIGTVRRPGTIGTIGRSAFKASFEGYGTVELTCLPSGTIDRFGRRLDRQPDSEMSDADFAALAEDPETALAEATPWPAGREPDLLLPYLDRLSDAATVTYPDVPNWLFFRTGSYCYASRRKADDRLLIGYNRKHDAVHLGFTATSLPPVPNGTKVTLDIILSDVDHKKQTAKPWSYWDPLTATALIGGSNEPVYSFKLAGHHALTSFSRHDVVLFVANGTDHQQGFSLSGSAAALRRLATCDPR